MAVAILAVMAAVATLGLAGLGGERQLEREAQRLQARLELACELAILDGRSFGLEAGAQDYRFLARIGGQWRPLEGRSALAAYRLPAGMRLDLQREGQALRGARDAGQSAAVPQVACLASGELTPFTAVLQAPGSARRFRLVGHVDMELVLNDEPASS